jgi:hypothetical protein
MDHNYFISELNAIVAHVDRVRRELMKAQEEEGQSQAAPQGQQAYQSTPTSAIRDPLAKSMSDLVTPKQLGMIRALAREAALDMDEECQSVFRCRTEELSKRAASSFIDHLKGCVNEFQQPRKAG